MLTNTERAQVLRTLDLLKQPMNDLAAWCQAFGQSGRGTREELIERLHRQIWRHEYD